LDLIFHEIFYFGYIQADPNPANFLYDSVKKKINCIDLGAGKKLTDTYFDHYYRMMVAASKGERKEVEKQLVLSGLMCGEENRQLFKKSIDLTMVVSDAISKNADPLYDFENQCVTSKVYELVGYIVGNRLVPSPGDAVNLDRKLLGMFLMLSKLKVKLPSLKMFKKVQEKHYVKYGY
jgi:predicted unusual protein kinase regulating ubiquinone biosynthesis (AarF/ABC1/UbiB family)